MDSIVAPVALVETLVAAVRACLDPAAEERMRAAEDNLAERDPGLLVKDLLQHHR
ncbi:hypothetical protein [Streptomyces niphimycinicus]|uniref:hypothetical protein n=1 Tax=Streptomyces niphimycinicus TaxID=2842201 RepID=UPI00209B7A0F|nr:hypothetical protein [Streptomyces niphimycinicus]